MEEPHLYQQIVAAVRSEILTGKLQPGDRLPSVRQMTARWNCTVGTVQHAYQELRRQGLVHSRAGQGTRVVDRLPQIDETPIRRASLVHRAEAFLLEVLTAGYQPAEIESALRQALDRWRVVAQAESRPPAQALRFSGSHDLVIAWLASHFAEIAPGYTLQLRFTGSLGGLIALAEGQADLAGTHLWDQETDSYNTPFVRRLLPGRRVALVTLAQRRLGLIVPAGNPQAIGGLEDLLRPDLRFANRQAGSGTRVWMDAAMRRLGLDSNAIQGYREGHLTHSEVAEAVAESRADAGIGLQAAALSYGLDFVTLAQDRYDLAITDTTMEQPPVQSLVAWLQTVPARKLIESLGGYEASGSGQVVWVG